MTSRAGVLRDGAGESNGHWLPARCVSSNGTNGDAAINTVSHEAAASAERS